VLDGAGPLLADGLDPDDLVELAETVLGSAAATLPPAGLPDALRAALGAAGSALASAGELGALLTSAGRREVLGMTARSIARNPAIWARLAERGLAGPMVEGLAAGLSAADAARALAPQLPVIWGEVLCSLVRHALRLAEATGPAAGEDAFRQLVARLAGAALAETSAALGRGLSGDDLPGVLARLLDRVPALAGGSGLEDVATLVRRAIDEVRAVPA
jgi:hypothetical protein